MKKVCLPPDHSIMHPSEGFFMTTPHANHRHCYLLRAQAESALPAFLSLCRNLSSLLICAQNTELYQALQDSTTSDKALKTLAFKQVKNELGQTHDGVLIDLTQGISASVLAIISGTIRGDGVLLIVLPEHDWLNVEDKDMARYLPWPIESADVKSYFKHYIQSKFLADDSPFIDLSLASLSQQEALPQITEKPSFTLTAEQTHVKQSLTLEEASLSNHVLIAPRGRGKSTLLGDCIATWVQQGKRVAVTAPNSDALLALKARFNTSMSAIDNINIPSLPFIAPDALAQSLLDISHIKYDYLVVDEAAMIPVPLLTTLLNAANHCVFSTTDYGYEGAGKGFGLRFCRHLEQLNTPFFQHTLKQPIRWGENDPLETWVNQTFFLSPPLLESSPNQSSTNALIYRTLKGQDWLTEQALLESTFNLLVNAHYQTSPDNLRWIMDNPAMSAWLLQSQSEEKTQLKSVAILTQEGQLSDEISRAVMEGTRRPRGHLIPQSLLAHEGIEDAGQYQYWRISRIATDAYEQQKGYGSQLLAEIERHARQHNIDFLSASFAVTLDTLSFWQKNGFICVRLGTAKDQASGCYSVMMLKPLKQTAKDKALLWHRYYLENLIINLPRDYQDIEERLAAKLRSTPLDEKTLTKQLTEKDKADLGLFTHHHRPYLTIRAPLTRLVKHAIEQGQLTKNDKDYALLTCVISESADQVDFTRFGLTTKKQVEKHLKNVVKALTI